MLIAGSSGSQDVNQDMAGVKDIAGSELVDVTRLQGIVVAWVVVVALEHTGLQCTS